MEENRCTTPTDHRTVSPKSPSHSITGSPVDDKSTVLGGVERASPEPNCAICLGKLQNKSFTNSCLHQYCFTCLLEWSKVKAECPLCKQGFQSIIHNVRSIEDYDQYDLLSNEAPYANWEEPRFRYRTTMTGNHNRFRLESTVPIVLQPLPPRRSQRAPWTRSRRQIATAEFRRSIYDRNLWVMPLRDVTGRYRDTSPAFYRGNPAQLHRLIPWLDRELTVLMESPARASLVVESLITMLQYHSMNSTTTRTFLRNAIGDRHVDHFIHEFITFARSPYDMIGFDETAEYGSYHNHTINITPSPPRSVIDDDSDIVVISSEDTDEDIEVNVEDSDENSPSFTNSSRRQTNVGNENTGSSTDVRIQVSHEINDSSDSDDCVIVGYVKPLHERTPEIVELDSDENIIEETVSSHEVRESIEPQTRVAQNSKRTLDVENPVASTSGYRHNEIESTVDSSRNIPVSEKKARTRQHKKKKTHSSRSKSRTSKKSSKTKRSRSSSSSDFSPKYKGHTRRLSSTSDSLSGSPVRRRRVLRGQSRKYVYTSDSSSYSPVRRDKSRTSNLSKLSYSSDSSSRSPIRCHTNKETEEIRGIDIRELPYLLGERPRKYPPFNDLEVEETRYPGYSSDEDYSYPLALRFPEHNTSSDNDSDFHQKPKLRSIVIPKTSNSSQVNPFARPSTSSSSSSNIRFNETTSNPWREQSHSHKSKHKQRRHERKKRRRKTTYSTSSSSDDIIRHPKRKSGKTVLSSESD